MASARSYKYLLIAVTIHAQLCINAMGDEIFINHHESLCIDTFTEQEVQYIYNRVFDICFKDSRGTIYLGDIYFDNLDDANSDSVSITLDPLLSNEIFELTYFKQLKNKEFTTIANLQPKFNKISILSTCNLSLHHFDSIPPLIGPHLIHFIMSPIKKSEGKYFIAVKIYYRMLHTNGLFHTDSTLIIEFEKCVNHEILFRRMYVPIGISLYDELNTAVHEFTDKACN